MSLDMRSQSPGGPPPPLSGHHTASSGGLPHSSSSSSKWNAKKKKRLSDRILPSKSKDWVPESSAYNALLSFERKLDSTIMRKRLDIQEALKRPSKSRRKLRLFLSYSAAGEDLELRLEGRLLPEVPGEEPTPTGAHLAEAPKRKKPFSSFFKSLFIELDEGLYGPSGHLIEWRRLPGCTPESDGFSLRRPFKGVPFVVTLLLVLDHQPLTYRLDPRLGRLLGLHSASRPVIVSALWAYIQGRGLQDPHTREIIRFDPPLAQIFGVDSLPFSSLPGALNPHLSPPEPLLIVRSVPGEEGRAILGVFDVELHYDESLKTQMNSFLLSTSSQNEINTLNNRILESLNTLLSHKARRDFLQRFAEDPTAFIHKWLSAQGLKDVKSEVEIERKTDFYYQPWVTEAVNRYFYSRILDSHGGCLSSDTQDSALFKHHL